MARSPRRTAFATLLPGDCANNDFHHSSIRSAPRFGVPSSACRQPSAPGRSAAVRRVQGRVHWLVNGCLSPERGIPALLIGALRR